MDISAIGGVRCNLRMAALTSKVVLYQAKVDIKGLFEVVLKDLGMYKIGMLRSGPIDGFDSILSNNGRT